MIFVTVGTGKFDKLIKVIDKNANRIREKIIMQIGSGSYKPKNCEFFRYKPSLREYYEKASLVIAHGGAGTTFELLRMGKRLISVANLSKRVDKHQKEILDVLSKQGYLIWHRNPKKILEDIKKAKKFRFKQYVPPECKIGEVIEKFISQLK